MGFSAHEVFNKELSIWNVCHGPPKPTFLEGFFMVNNLVFRWPRPLFFMVLGAHGVNILNR